MSRLSSYGRGPEGGPNKNTSAQEGRRVTIWLFILAFQLNILLLQKGTELCVLAGGSSHRMSDESQTAAGGAGDKGSFQHHTLTQGGATDDEYMT